MWWFAKLKSTLLPLARHCLHPAGLRARSDLVPRPVSARKRRPRYSPPMRRENHLASTHMAAGDMIAPALLAADQWESGLGTGGLRHFDGKSSLPGFVAEGYRGHASAAKSRIPYYTRESAAGSHPASTAATLSRRPRGRAPAAWLRALPSGALRESCPPRRSRHRDRQKQ